MKLICGCGYVLHNSWLIDLKDKKDFIKRKILMATCPKCNQIVLSMTEKRIEDDKTFINENLYGKRAINVLHKEKNNILERIEVKDCSRIRWAYGQNVQIRNKHGEVIKVRQYAKDFSSGKRSLEKELCCK